MLSFRLARLKIFMQFQEPSVNIQLENVGGGIGPEYECQKQSSSLVLVFLRGLRFKFRGE